ncbi:MAG: TIGR03545 family protein [Elusimicrobia bacterium]|nr:TIGR03545 family protein [Elusimicrobiota bacterium]
MRWKYFIPVSAFVVICFVFSIFFLDMILKSAFISGGEMVFGAKVEIASVKTKFRNLSINISGLKIANRSDFFRNLIEIDSIRFALKPLPLLSKKVIIEEMALDGLMWNTKRDLSGALPPRKEKKFVKKEKKENKSSPTAKLFSSIKEKAGSEASALPAADKIKEVQKEFKNISFTNAVSLADLKSIGEMDALKSSYSQKYSQYDSQLKSLDLDQKISKAVAALNEISSIKIETIQDIEPAKTKLDSFNSTREELNNTISQLQLMQSQMSQDFGSEKDVLAKINQLKEGDYKALADKLKLPSFSFGNLSQSIFGPVWLDRVHKILYYLEVARKYMPPKKKNEKMVNTRLKGRDISFPKEDNPPDFLIGKIIVSGTTGGYGKEGEPLDFKGVITGITSDPVLLGRPTKIDISGSQGKRTLILYGVLDHTTDKPVDTLNILFSGLSAQSLGIPSSDYLPDMKNGKGVLDGRLILKGENIASNMELKISGFKSSGVETDETRKIILSLWKGISEIIVNAKLSGTFENLSFSISSNMDKILSERLKNMLGAKFAEVQNKLKAEITRLTNQKKDEVMGEFNLKKSELTKQYGDKQKEIQSKTDEIKSKIASKENEGKDQADKEKKKAEDQVRKQAEQKLKELNLFK